MFQKILMKRYTQLGTVYISFIQNTFPRDIHFNDWGSRVLTLVLM